MAAKKLPEWAQACLVGLIVIAVFSGVALCGFQGYRSDAVTRQAHQAACQKKRCPAPYTTVYRWSSDRGEYACLCEPVPKER